MRCDRCGEENPERARFCLACGSPLDSPGREARKTVTVVFCDVAGSTALGERLDSEAVRRVMTRYFNEMRLVLERYGGTVEKFIGDAIVAVFGAPVAHEDDALRALGAAVEMRDRLAELNYELEREWGVTLSVRTGVNTGEVVAGDPATAQSFVVGDAVNVAARLEQAAAAGEILIGETTRSLAGDAITVEPVDPLTLKGKSKPVVAARLCDVHPHERSDRRADTPFVGREKERAALQAALEQAIDDCSCMLATIVGAPGIGKSRLARTFAASVSDRTRLVVGRCLPYGDGITYWPLTEIVREIAGEVPKEGLNELLAGTDDAARVADAILAAVGAVEGGTQPEQIFWAFRKLFERLAEEQPLVIVVDDIHWAEPTLLDLLEYVVEFAIDAPILLLCLARADLFETRPSWATPKPNAVTVQLQPMSNADADTLIDGLVGGRNVSPEARDRIAEAADGNPLFIEQLLALNADAGTGNGELLVPPTIQALLAARIDRLDGGERAVIESAAIEGRTFHRGALAELVEDSARGSIGTHLMSLIRKEFIRPDRTLFAGDDAFRFHHILIRDAAYEGVPKQLRAALHERFAHWLERAAGPAVSDYEEIVAYHLEQAYRHRVELGPINGSAAELAFDAGSRLATAGRRALGRTDVPAAVNLLTRAADLLPTDDVQRLELLPELAAALIDAGQLARAQAVASEAAAGAQACGNERALWRARLVLLSFQIWTAPKNREVLAGAERAAEAVERLEDHVALARAYHLIGQTQNWIGHGAAAVDAFERALDHARRARAQREQSDSLTWLLITTWYGPIRADQGIERCRGIVERPPDPRSEAYAQIELGAFLASQGRFDEGRALLRRGRALLADLGLRIAAASTAQELFDLEVLADQPAAAEQELRRACATLEGMGEKGFLATRLGCLAEAIYAQGRYEEAEHMSEVAERASTDFDDVDAQFRWRAVRAKTLARRGELQEAEQLARDAADLISHSDWLNIRAGMQLDLAEVLSAAGKRSEAIGAIEQAVELYEQKQNLVGARRARKLHAGRRESHFENGVVRS